MPDSKLIERSGERILTSTGVPAAGAKIYVYDAGTTNLATIYSNSTLTTPIANPQTCDSAGLAPYIYVGTDAYKLRIETSAGVLIDEEDNIPGAIDTGDLSATYARPQQPAIVKTTNYTVLAADLGKIINCNSTGGAFTVTLLNAATAGDGATVTIRQTGTANQVRIVTSSSETIAGPFSDGAVGSFSLTGYGESVTLVSDNAGWHVVSYVPPLMRGNMGVIPIIDRITAAPVSPVNGGRYLVTASFSTFETHDIIEFSGQTGTYIEYTPATDCGWIAYVQDEDAMYQYQGTAWVALAATQTIMEAGTSLATFSTPANQHHHPGHPKAFAYITNTGTATITTDWGFSSVSTPGTGQVSLTFDTPNMETSTSYAPVASFIGSPSGLRLSGLWCLSLGEGGFTVNTTHADGASSTVQTDANRSFGVVVHGNKRPPS